MGIQYALNLQWKSFIKHNLGQLDTIHQHDWILPFLTSFVYGGLREMTCCDDGSSRERL